IPILQEAAEQREHALSSDQAARAPRDVHEPQHCRPCEARDPLLLTVELSRGVGAADERAYRGAADEIRLDITLFQRPDGADVRPSTRASGAEGEADARFTTHWGNRTLRPDSVMPARRWQRSPGHRQCTW